MNLRSSVIAAAALATLTACTNTVDVPPARPFAFIDVNEVPTDSTATSYVAIAQSIFTKARISGVIGSTNLAEGCAPPDTIVSGLATTDTPFDPGTVTLGLHGSVDTTTRTVPLEMHTFVTGVTWLNSVNPPLKPGTDTVIFSASGVAGGFPPFQLRAATVPTFTAQSVDDSVTGTGILAQWTPSPIGASAMQITLQYADSNAKSASIPNREVVCIARDDGSFSINRTFLDAWEEAGVDSLHRARQVIYSRFLTTSGTVSDAIITAVVRRDTTIVKPR